MMKSIARRGQRLAFANWNLDTNVLRLDLNSSPAQASRLIVSSRRDESTDYSPDGTRVVFSSRRGGHGCIWLANADGTQALSLVADHGKVGSPRWSPDGSQIAFDSDRDRAGDVYLVNANGGPTRRFTFNSAWNRVPTWSLNGQLLYFVKAREAGLWKVPSRSGTPVKVIG